MMMRTYARPATAVSGPHPDFVEHHELPVEKAEPVAVIVAGNRVDMADFAGLEPDDAALAAEQVLLIANRARERKA